MIVKNEATVIERCLGSARGLIDSWLICDTGSSDGTQEIVRAALADLHGELRERPWIDFGHNRTESMRLARDAADYLLVLDADTTVTWEPGVREGLEADAYLLKETAPEAARELWIKRLLRADRDWRYVGAVHEYPASPLEERSETLEGIVVHHHADGGSRQGRLTRDLELLERAHEREPEEPRTAFYLAQTHRDLGQPKRALELYRRRITLGGWDEEVFYARYQAGVLEAELGDWPSALHSFLEAWEQRPQRAEPLYQLAWRLRERSRHQAAHLFAGRGLDSPQPPDILFVEPWVYRWGLLFEYSVSAYWVGQVEQALTACERLLAMDDLPAEFREHTVRNRGFCLRASRDR